MSAGTTTSRGRFAGFAAATVLMLLGGLIQPMAAHAAGTASIEGHMPGGNGRITLYSASTLQVVNTATTQALDMFYFQGLPAGDYRLGFEVWTDVYHGAIPKIPEFWDDKPTLAESTVITLSEGQALTGLEVQLADEAPSISGQLIADGADFGYQYGDKELRVYTLAGETVPSTQTRLELDGSYRVWGIPAGTYYFSAQWVEQAVTSYAKTFACSVPLMAGSTQVVVATGATTTVPPITLPEAASLSGTYTVEDAGTITAGFNPRLELLRFDDAAQEFIEFPAVPSFQQGVWSVGDLWPGTYLAHFYNDGTAWIGPEWWPNGRTRADAEEIELDAGEHREDVDVSFEVYTFFRDRVAGADRFATNVAMSLKLFPAADGPHNIPVLYIASGMNYPDALSAGPAAVHLGGELLLVMPDSVPQVVQDEIERLNPQRIVVVGGTSTVSTAVYNLLATLTPSISRQAGADRYTTSRILVENAFECDDGTCTEQVFVATGANYPDALAAGPAASANDAPVLLVDGLATGLSTATVALLDDLGVTTASILGAPNVVSYGVEDDLNDALTGDVIRYAGMNRFHTAVLLNEANFGQTEYAFLASGFGFADALSGGPLAAGFNAPMYLTQQDCLGEAVRSMIKQRVDVIVLLGGEATLSPNVYNLQLCS